MLDDVPPPPRCAPVEGVEAPGEEEFFASLLLLNQAIQVWRGGWRGGWGRGLGV